MVIIEGKTVIMPKFNAPDSLDFTRPTTWPEWKARFARYRIATKLSDDDENVQVACLIYAMGPEAEQVFKSFTFADDCDKEFSRYLCGLETFKLITDHKPLVPLINKKNLDDTPLRYQRLMRFNLTAEYAPGKTLVIADALSRLPVDKPVPSDLEGDIAAYVDSVILNQPISDRRLGEIA